MNTPQEFAPLFAGLQRLQQQNFGTGAALVTLLRTRGSTFRRAGARMLVGGDGSVVRGLSGGCPEADMIAHAKDVIAAGAPARLLRYDREHGYDALLELGCGGELEVLIEPLRTAADLHFVHAAEHCLRRREAGVLATVYARDRQCLPRPLRLVWAGRAARIDELGAVQDPGLSAAVAASAARILDARAAQTPPSPEVATLHGDRGRYEVLYEQLLPPYALSVFGVNAGAIALARIARLLGWAVTLVDHRSDRPRPAGLPAEVRYLAVDADSVQAQLAFDPRSFAVVMTHNLQRDIDYLQALAAAPLAYLGAIGSRQRCAQLVAATGLQAPRLHAPAGLDLGSETPEEIALAIAAEILAVSGTRSAAPLSALAGPIHGALPESSAESTAESTAELIAESGAESVAQSIAESIAESVNASPRVSAPASAAPGVANTAQDPQQAAAVCCAVAQ